MTWTGRRALTRADKAAVFKRFKSGERLTDIAVALGRTPGTIHSVLRRYGGIAPTERSRSGRALRLEEREEISRGVVAGESLRSIARRLCRPASTISREVNRNGGRQAYRAAEAEKQAAQEGLRPKACKLAKGPRLARLVAKRLQGLWSPQQISGWLRAEYPSDSEMQVSSETIYRTLFIQARGALKKQLLTHLRQGRQMRRPKASLAQAGKILDAISISERPAEVEDRAVPGHWEGDLIAGKANQSFIGTLVERQTRFVKLIRVASKDSTDFAKALEREVVRLPEALVKSITWDRGTEMAKHKAFTVATDVKVYFCDPHSPWQRGSNENTNGLLRQYFPKGTDFSRITQKQLDKAAASLNGRPRLTLHWRTPAQKLSELVALTG